MRRRTFITLLGAAVAWPLPTSAQQNWAQPHERMRRIGILWPYTEGDPDSRSRIESLRQALADLGWTEDRNLRFEYRWGAGADAPDVIVAGSGGIAVELKRTTRTVPIVFPTANDPVGTGLVETLTKPGGNATGFSGFESANTEKLLDLLKQIAPSITRVAIIRNPTRGGGNASFGAIQAAAAPFKIAASAIDLRTIDALERGVAAFAVAPNGGLIVPPAALATTHRGAIINLAARYRLPAIYPLRLFVADGGLMSWGPVTTDLYPRVAGTIDRILKGEKPGDLPVGFPTRFELVVNAKTARALDVPPALLTIADDVIE